MRPMDDFIEGLKRKYQNLENDDEVGGFNMKEMFDSLQDEDDAEDSENDEGEEEEEVSSDESMSVSQELGQNEAQYKQRKAERQSFISYIFCIMFSSR